MGIVENNARTGKSYFASGLLQCRGGSRRLHRVGNAEMMRHTQSHFMRNRVSWPMKLPIERGHMSVHHRLVSALGFVILSFAVSAQVPVQVESVTLRSIDRQIEVSGTITSPRTAILSTAVAGLVSGVTVDEGDRIKPGATLLTLDDELAQLALERARAEVRQHEVALEDARRRFAEAETVGKKQGIARSEVESLRAEVTSREAALAASQAASREQRALVERHTLKAPFAGVISQRMTELGEWINPGDGLLELVATDDLRFDFRVGQQSFAELTTQARVDITIDALPGRSVAGRIDKIVPVKSPSARTFLVRVLADPAQSDAVLRITPGMSVRGILNTNTGRSGTVVSRDAILRFPDGRTTAWVVDTGDDLPIVRERIVGTGLEFDGLVEVTSGLDEGELVVVRGNETLQEGQAVSILDPEL